jgi:hypothetical protein
MAKLILLDSVRARSLAPCSRSDGLALSLTPTTELRFKLVPHVHHRTPAG